MSMTNEAMRIAIAELCGWTKLEYKSNIGHAWVNHKLGSVSAADIPNYPLDLNACADMRRQLTMLEERVAFLNTLRAIAYKRTGKPVSDLDMMDSTGSEQCEAMLKVKGKWVE